MGPGSIVVVKKINIQQIDPCILSQITLPVDDEKTPYMIRMIDKDNDGDLCAIFEEFSMGRIDGQEVGILLTYLIELLPPEDISEMMSEIQENHQVIWL